MEEYKENSPTSTQAINPSTLPYRSIFAVLTLDSVLIYDTFHSKPLSISRGYHCSGLTDCSWSSDGHNLVVSSNDGYISILRFAKGELGEVYREPLRVVQETQPSLEGQPEENLLIENQSTVRSKSSTLGSTHQELPVTLLPCDPGSSSTIVGPPCKKIRNCTSDDDTIVSILDDPTIKSNLSISLVATSSDEQKERSSSTFVDPAQKLFFENKENEDGFVGAVTKLSLAYPGSESSSITDGIGGKKHPLEEPAEETMEFATSVPVSKKPKKRIQPTHMGA